MAKRPTSPTVRPDPAAIIEVPPIGGQPQPNAEGVVEYPILGKYIPNGLQNVRKGASDKLARVKQIAGGVPTRVYFMAILQPSGDTWLSVTEGDKLYTAFIVGDRVFGKIEFDHATH